MTIERTLLIDLCLLSLPDPSVCYPGVPSDPLRGQAGAGGNSPAPKAAKGGAERSLLLGLLFL